MKLYNLSLVLSASLVLIIAAACGEGTSKQQREHKHQDKHHDKHHDKHDHDCKHDHGHGHSHDHKSAAGQKKEALAKLRETVLDSNAKMEEAYAKECGNPGNDDAKKTRCAEARKLIDEQIESNNQHIASLAGL